MSVPTPAASIPTPPAPVATPIPSEDQIARKVSHMDSVLVRFMVSQVANHCL